MELVSLDSPRWKQLRDAYGSAELTPDLIKRVADESDPSLSPDPARLNVNSPWDEVWSSLCHQGTIYPATYAALPHLVSIAGNGNLWTKVQTLTFAGDVCSQENSVGEVPEDLAKSFEDALKVIKQMSLPIIREAVVAYSLHQCPLPYLLKSAVALRAGPRPMVQLLEEMGAGGESEVDIECPQCSRYMVLDLSDIPTEEEEADLPVTAREVNEGLRLLNKGEDSWTADCIVQIVAALAFQLGDGSLSRTFLNLHASAKCPECEHLFRIAHGLVAKPLMG